MDVTEFRAVYDSKGKSDLKVQVPYLAELGDYYEILGSADPVKQWTSLLKVRYLGGLNLVHKLRL